MSLGRNGVNLIITGVGGQGNVLAARLLASVALAEGYTVTVGDVYGLTQRGGSVASHVRWTEGKTLPPLVPQNSLDVLVAFEPLEALRILTQFGKEDTVAVVNDAPIMPIGVQAGRFTYPNLSDLWDALRSLTKQIRLVGATAVSQRLGDIQVLNMVMTGALLGSGFVTLKKDGFEKTIHSVVSRKYVDIDLLAFREGIQLVKGPS
jgi:indolepyruvate ferredoxin oxidoreductase beta subunit